MISADRLRGWPRDVARRCAFVTARLWDPVYIALYRRRSGFHKPIPPLRNRHRVGMPWVSPFLEGGTAATSALTIQMEKYLAKPISDVSVLDLGAGCGRIALHLGDRVGHLATTDVDASASRWIRRNLPGVRSAINQPNPPLPFPDAEFDVVYAWSLWTHFSESAEAPWLLDLKRVLRPGGLALLTTNGSRALADYLVFPGRDEQWDGVTVGQLHDAGILYREYDTATARIARTGAPYGLTFHDADYVRRVWAAYFEILAIDEGGMHNGQDLIVLRRS